MRKKLFKTATIIALSLFSVGQLTSCDTSGISTPNSNTSNSTSADVTGKALVELTTNGHGSVTVANLDTNNMATLNTAYTVTATPDTGYVLSSVNVNGTDITSALTFTPTDATVNYIVNATFITDVNPGKTSLKLTGKTGVEVGKTMQLTTTVYGPNASVTYASSDAKIATVDANGLVTGVKAGFVTVTATSVLSTETDPLTSSFTFFVEPSYIARMVEGFDGYDYANGVTFNGAITLNTAPSKSDGKVNSNAISYTLNVKKNADSSSILDAYYFDFKLDLSKFSLITFIGKIGLAMATGNNNLSNANALDIAYFGDGNLQLSAYVPDTTDATKSTIGYYKEVSIFDAIPSIAKTVVPMISGTSIDTSSLDLSTIAPILNSVLVFDDTKTNISVSSSIVALLAKTVTSGVNSIIKKVADSSMSALKTTVAQLLPGTIDGLTFTIDLNEDNTFKGFNFAISNTKQVTDASDSTKKADYTYDYLTIDLTKNATALTADYFSTLGTALETAATEQEEVNAVLDQEQVLNENLTGSTVIPDTNAIDGVMSTDYTKHYSIYNAIRNSSDFKTNLEAYVPAVAALKSGDKAITNTSMISTALDEYGVFCNFDVQDADGDDLEDVNYTAKVGDVLSLKNESLFGAATGTTLSAPLTYTIENNTYSEWDSTANKDVVKETYVTYDETAKTLTVNKLPEEDTYVTVTSDVPTDSGYTSLTFRFLLPAAAVTD